MPWQGPRGRDHGSAIEAEGDVVYVLTWNKPQGVLLSAKGKVSQRQNVCGVGRHRVSHHAVYVQSTHEAGDSGCLWEEKRIQG